MAKNAPSISIFFPCYNDEKSIGVLVEKAFTVLQPLTDDYEVIVVDDASADNSREVLTKLTNKYKNLKLVFHEKNKGYGGALQSGFRAASKDLVFYTDGDGQYDVEEFPILLSLMTSDTDFVNGIKMERGDAPYRIFVGNMYRFAVRWAFWLPIVDVDCDFRLIRTKITSKLKLTKTSGAICTELVKKAQHEGAVFRQVSVHHYERKHGSSQFFKLNRILHTFWDMTHLWFTLILFRI
jgi:glycosyltransferase involved in cell wall biosynthesis